MRLWDVATGEPAGALPGHAGPPWTWPSAPMGHGSPAWDMTGRCGSGTSRPGAQIGVLTGDAEGYRIAYSKDGRLIAAASVGRGNVRLWDAAHVRRARGLAAREPGVRPGVQSGRHPAGDRLR